MFTIPLRLIRVTFADPADLPIVGRIAMAGPAASGGMGFGIRIMHEVGPDDYRRGEGRWVDEAEIKSMEWFAV